MKHTHILFALLDTYEIFLNLIHYWEWNKIIHRSAVWYLDVTPPLELLSDHTNNEFGGTKTNFHLHKLFDLLFLMPFVP